LRARDKKEEKERRAETRVWNSSVQEITLKSLFTAVAQFLFASRRKACARVPMMTMIQIIAIVIEISIKLMDSFNVNDTIYNP